MESLDGQMVQGRTREVEVLVVAECRRLKLFLDESSYKSNRTVSAP